jgi:hypothetical protein
MKYSKTTTGFYDETIHTTFPPDAVDITPEYHGQLLQLQSDGKLITADANGYPIAVDYPAITTDELASQVRAKRDSLLTVTDWTQNRDVPIAVSDKYTAYRQALRDITSQPGFPSDVIWPVKPI